MKINGQEHPDPNATLGDVMRILAERQEEHRVAKEDLEKADRAESHARTALDKAQEDFDQRVEAIKAKAPQGSHWQRQKIKPVGVKR